MIAMNHEASASSLCVIPEVNESSSMTTKRLPRPATWKESSTCSGVSMLSWSLKPVLSKVDMITNAWMDYRKHNWTRLDTLLRQVEQSSVKHLSASELRELGLLYRQAAADLS